MTAEWHLTCFFNSMLSLFHTALSQISQIIVNQTLRVFKPILMAVAIIIGLMVGTIPAQASSSSLDGNLRKTEVYKVNLSKLSALDTPRLDWRNPGFDFAFELPTSDWVDNIDLFLNVHAESRPNNDAPIYIQFNTAEPVAVYPRGHSFEARLTLDKSKVNSYRNTIRVSFASPDGCVDKVDGAWSIDLDDSLIVVKASTPSRPYHLRDVKKILQSPLTTPKTVAIKASGHKNLKLEALAAQGIALNMPTLPRFNLTTGASDMEIYVGTRSQIASIIKGSKIAKAEGPVIGITRNAPLRMVLTGDNENQVMDLVKAFAANQLPPSRREFAHSGEYSWQTPQFVSNQAIKGKTPIFELGNMIFDRGWGNSTQTVSFDVDNPLAAHGSAKLYFQKGPNVTKDSSVNVELNGKALGTVSLAHSRNAVKFDLPRGILRGTNNVLAIKPELAPKDAIERCGTETYMPGFAVESRSYINIKTEADGFAGDLTRFAASGFPFSEKDGVNTTVVLATANRSERASALRAIAQLGNSYGTGWVDADFVAKGKSTESSNRHVLHVGSQINASAPRGLNAAISGRISPPKIVKTASLDTASISLMSVREGRAVTGGVAALYADAGRVEGFLTNSRGHSFTRAMDNLVKADNWNNLQGSMARWDRNSVEMTKTAFKLETIAPLTPEVTQVRDHSINLPSLEMPEIDWSDINWPSFDLPEINWPEFSMPKLPAREPKPEVTISTPKIAIPEITTPDIGAPKIAKPKVALPKIAAPKITAPVTVAEKPNLDLPQYVPPGKPDPKELKISGNIFGTYFTDLGQSWNNIVARSTEIFARNPEPAIKPLDINVLDIPTAVAPPVAERFPPMPSPKPTPNMRLKPAPKMDNGYLPARLPQYVPGASLRNNPAEIAEVPTNSWSESFKSSILAAYSGSSNWASNVMDKSQPSPFKESTKTKGRANMVLFAALIMLLLILLALASPRSARN